MILRAIAASLAILGLISCGQSGTPCTGSTCLQVAGTYALTITQTPGTTCKYFTYQGDTAAEAAVTQAGNQLTLTFTNSPVPQSESGTLDTNGTASFNVTGQVTVTDDQGNTYPYNDTNILNVTFTAAANNLTNITGQVSDTLSALMPNSSGYPDPECILEGSLTGTD